MIRTKNNIKFYHYIAIVFFRRNNIIHYYEYNIRGADYVERENVELNLSERRAIYHGNIVTLPMKLFNYRDFNEYYVYCEI